MKKALITGITGQDGSYLAEFLLGKGYEVAGIIRRLSTPNIHNIEKIRNKIKIYDGDLLDQGSIDRSVKDFQPDEIYNLAAQTFVATSWSQPVLTGEITGLGAVRVFESIRNFKPDCKIYQASSSEMFGNTPDDFINENSPMHATSPYAIAKLYAHLMAKNYRNSYGIFTSSGILFNHESPRRGIEFVTRKITYAISAISEGITETKTLNEQKEPLVRNGKVKLGNLDASRDWGYAKDYVEAMYLMLQQEKGDDYVIATGKSATIREVLDIAFNYAGIKDWENYVEIDPRFKRPSELRHLRGDASKAKKVLDWEPKTTLKELIALMIDSDKEIVKKIEK